MSALISLEKIYLSYGSDPLLDHIHFQIEPGERVCLIGRNGAGKSSFLKVIDGHVQPDSGKIHRHKSLRIARLEQELPQTPHQTVLDVISEGLAGIGQEWELSTRIDKALIHLGLPATQKILDLSGGWQRRLSLTKALLTEPDLLLLDEPTNHLDIEAIQWLEEQLLQFKGGILFITHDRTLLCRLATRIIELDRGNLTSWPGDYANFLRRKEEALSAEATVHKEFDKKLAEEERWIRQGIKARRTRNEGRVRALEAMRKERQERREIQGTATLMTNTAHQSGQLIANVEQVSHAYGDKVIIRDFSTRIMRGERIGLLGPNGVGKTTLLNILLGKTVPEQGKVQLGTKLKVAYFDQLRATLDPEKSILDNVAGGRTSVTINGKERHVVGYLNDFLFAPDRLRTPVKALSGGECNRLLLAQLFSLPANVLVMDEPTNDLDIETLELLEELLSQFTGTLLLVSHDRTFLDNIVTSTLVFEGDGYIGEYVGGYHDWLRQAGKPSNVISPIIKDTPKTKPAKTGSLTGNEHKEFSSLPGKIEQYEKKQAEYYAQMAEPDFYAQPAEKIEQVLQKLKQLEQDIAQAYQRWEALDKKLLG